MPFENQKRASGEAGVSDMPEEMIHIDGRTLEGGGQLVRNAVALSALTGKPITISNIRGNRHGKTGLKGSHAAAIQFISEICQGEVVGGQVGSQTLTFYPRKRELYYNAVAGKHSPSSVSSQLRFLSLGLPTVKPEYSIQQHTAGSISLVFQALYPYLVYASSLSMADNARQLPTQVHITGGTNVTHSPSFDYLDQVLAPNLLRCGLPKLSISLHKRGWSTGPKDLGAVTFYIHPLAERQGKTTKWFPPLKLGQHRRTAITRIHVTILAPDIDLKDQEAQGNRQARRKAARNNNNNSSSDDTFQNKTVREYLEDRIQNVLSHAMMNLEGNSERRDGDSERSEWQGSGSRVPIQIHVSEATHHHTHIYILLVAHMSNGIRLGRDALFHGYAKHGGGKSGRGRVEKDGSSKGSSDGSSNMVVTLDRLVDSCVADLVGEVRGRDGGDGMRHQPSVDVYMRDQLVIFEALGQLDQSAERGTDGDKLQGQEDYKDGEDEGYWSLHTRTARWVCEQILGSDIWDGT